MSSPHVQREETKEKKEDVGPRRTSARLSADDASNLRSHVPAHTGIPGTSGSGDSTKGKNEDARPLRRSVSSRLSADSSIAEWRAKSECVPKPAHSGVPLTEKMKTLKKKLQEKLSDE